MKNAQQVEVIQLRRQGVSYQALMRRFGVAKSTVWRWLKAEGLVATQPQQFTEARRLAQQRGAASVKAQRMQRTEQVMTQASAEIGTLSRRDLWLIGMTLYWAEGSKQKATAVSRGVIFANSDPRVVATFVTWLTQICQIDLSAITFELYLHETANAESARKFWKKELRLSAATGIPVYWKRHQPQTTRHNIGCAYHGLVRVKVRRSTQFNRRIAGWIEGLVQGIGESSNGRTSGFGPEYPGSIPGSPAIVTDGRMNRLNQIGDLTYDGALESHLMKELITA